MIWLFLSVVALCATAIYSLRLVLAQKRWVKVADFDFLKAELAKCQRTMVAFERGLLKLSRKLGFAQLQDVVAGRDDDKPANGAG